MDLLKCQNHQVNLTMVECVSSTEKVDASGGGLIANLYCGTLFLRMGGHFQRLASSIQAVVESEELFVWNQNPSPEDLRRGCSSRTELVSYLTDNLRHHQRQMAGSGASGCAGGVLLPLCPMKLHYLGLRPCWR